MIVAKTYKWQNGMAMVFDENGEQIPELQGRATRELAEEIRSHSTPETEWIGWGEDGPAVWPTKAVEDAYVWPINVVEDSYYGEEQEDMW